MTDSACRGHPASQLDKFKEAARELETDDDPKRFGERLGKLVKQNSEPQDNTAKGRKGG